MSNIRAFVAGFAAIGLFALPTAAQAQGASSPDELLRQIEAASSSDAAAFDRSVAEFNALPEAQKLARLQEAVNQRNALTAVSDGLSAQYTANETRILEANRALNAKAASVGLAEVFGLTREVAGDVAVVLQQSIVTSQFPAPPGEPSRDEILRDLAEARTLPVIDDLERLWFEIQREIGASGQVARYTAGVVQPGGDVVEAEVVRIGTFTAMSDGRYVQFMPELGVLNVLPRQLPNSLMRVGGAFERATDGYSEAVVDPYRGVTLGLYVQRPSLWQRVENGEKVNYIIIAVGAAGVLAFLFQLVYLILARLSVSKQLKSLNNPRKDNPLGRVLLAFRGDAGRIEEDADIAELRIAEAVLHEAPGLERFQAFLRLCVAAGPLLGLVGTVWGMILTFQAITEAGSSDPRLMAEGIGAAMIATLLGLGIAVPLLFANALLNSLSRDIVQTLDEQSAGMLAESLERKRGV